MAAAEGTSAAHLDVPQQIPPMGDYGMPIGAPVPPVPAGAPGLPSQPDFTSMMQLMFQQMQALQAVVAAMQTAGSTARQPQVVTAKLDERVLRNVDKFSNKREDWKEWKLHFLTAVRECDQPFAAW